ncbi:MAG: hypothetical protein JWP89_2776 [Schlesneria sp.]|nr:hypothetical protein [Schlesneria sp.]
MSPELLEKLQHLGTPNGLLCVPLNVGGQASSPGRDGHGPDHRDFAGVTSPVDQLRSLAEGCPGALDVGCQQQSAFIDEDEVGLVSPGLFLRRGQSRATQPLTTSWLRSRGRNQASGN